jgi:hypothetical protein
VGKASSAKKVAKVAESARGVKVREPRGKVFPAALASVIILGSLLVWYSRQSSLASASTKPVANADHFHVAFGVYNCDKWLANVQNNNETAGTPDNEQFKVTGIHTHADGVIHVHPYGSAGSGKNAKLGTWFGLVGAKLSDSKLEMPEGLGTITTADKCGEKTATLKGLVWEDANSTGAPKVYLTDLKSIRFDKSGMAISIVFVPDDVDINTLKPPSAANLAALGAADSGSATAATASTATTVAGAATTVAGDGSSTTAAATSSSTVG